MNNDSQQFKVFISKQIPELAAASLNKNFDLEVWNKDTSPNYQELIQKSKDCHALICMLSDKIDANFIDSCPKLKVIANYAVGFNNIDYKYAHSKGIQVCNTPDVLTDATAELALALMLSVSRRIVCSHKSVEAGNWQGWEPLGFLGPSLQNKTLGIVGMGRIGLSLAKKCNAAFNMDILYHSRNEKPEANSIGAKKTSLEELLSSSDVVSVHCPLTNETKGLFDQNTFMKMKKGSIFINTGRGELHDEEALFHVIQNGHLDGAGLDVTNPEPMKNDSPLLNLKNVVVSPHIGSATYEARDAMAKLCAENINKVLNNEDPITPVII